MRLSLAALALLPAVKALPPRFTETSASTAPATTHSGHHAPSYTVVIETFTVPLFPTVSATPGCLAMYERDVNGDPDTVSQTTTASVTAEISEIHTTASFTLLLSPATHKASPVTPTTTASFTLNLSKNVQSTVTITSTACSTDATAGPVQWTTASFTIAVPHAPTASAFPSASSTARTGKEPPTGHIHTTPCTSEHPVTLTYTLSTQATITVDPSPKTPCKTISRDASSFTIPGGPFRSYTYKTSTKTPWAPIIPTCRSTMAVSYTFPFNHTTRIPPRPSTVSASAIWHTAPGNSTFPWSWPTGPGLPGNGSFPWSRPSSRPTGMPFANSTFSWPRPSAGSWYPKPSGAPSNSSFPWNFTPSARPTGMPMPSGNWTFPQPTGGNLSFPWNTKPTGDPTGVRPRPSMSPHWNSSTSLPLPTEASRKPFATSLLSSGLRRRQVKALAFDKVPLLNFDDFTVQAGPNHAIPKMQTSIAEYHGFYFTAGFSQVSYATAKYIPSSMPGMLQYQVSDHFVESVAQISAVDQNSTFSLLGWNMGCDSTDEPCQFNITGVRLEEEVATQSFVVDACANATGCQLAAIVLNSTLFADLTSFMVELIVDGDPFQAWWADDLQVA